MRRGENGDPAAAPKVASSARRPRVSCEKGQPYLINSCARAKGTKNRGTTPEATYPGHTPAHVMPCRLYRSCTAACPPHAQGSGTQHRQRFVPALIRTRSQQGQAAPGASSASSHSGNQWEQWQPAPTVSSSCAHFTEPYKSLPVACWRLAGRHCGRYGRCSAARVDARDPVHTTRPLTAARSGARRWICARGR